MIFISMADSLITTNNTGVNSGEIPEALDYVKTFSGVITHDIPANFNPTDLNMATGGWNTGTRTLAHTTRNDSASEEFDAITKIISNPYVTISHALLIITISRVEVPTDFTVYHFSAAPSTLGSNWWAVIGSNSSSIVMITSALDIASTGNRNSDIIQMRPSSNSALANYGIMTLLGRNYNSGGFDAAPSGGTTYYSKLRNPVSAQIDLNNDTYKSMPNLCLGLFMYPNATWFGYPILGASNFPITIYYDASIDISYAAKS